MQPIITQPCRDAHANPDVAARQRADRLAGATTEQMHDALAFLSVIDPEAFEIALTAVSPAAIQRAEDEEPAPFCPACGAPVGIFPEHGLTWQHYHGDGTTAGTQQVYDPGHAPEIIWCLPGEDPQDL
ncbi:MAG: hypothetical protein ACRDNW_05815 [Trebonia sp.]